MKRRFVFAVACLALASEVSAQVIIVPNPVFVAPPSVVLVPSGLGISYPRRNFTISGFYGPGYALVPVGSPFIYGSSYGAYDNRVTVRVISPRIVVSPQRVAPALEVDLRGVDLDVVGPAALKPGGNPELAKIPLPPPNKKPPEKVEVAKPEAPKKEAPPAKPVPPKPPVAEKPAQPGGPEPKGEPLGESRRLTDMGLLAFRAREYGLAAMRFRQASELEPAQSRPHFLLAQAYLALGKYKNAVTAIENGMNCQEDWPLSGFRPRAELYKDIEEDWFAHKTQLADVQVLHPNQPEYLFLQAYQWWFDGQRDQAAEMFERARVLAPGNAFIGAFLKVIPKLAAK